MSVLVRLIDAHDGRYIAETSYAGIPPVGSHLMHLERDWEIYVVQSIRLWPSKHRPDNELLGQPVDTEPLVEAIVAYKGSID